MEQHHPVHPFVPHRPARGGWRQRREHELQLERERSRSRSPIANRVGPRLASGGHLFRRWTLDYCWGDISAQRFGEYCCQGRSDGLQHPSLLRVAKTASGEHSSHNLSRVLARLFRAEDIGVLIDSIEGSVVRDVALPHKLFSRIAAVFRTAFVNTSEPTRRSYVFFGKAYKRLQLVEASPIDTSTFAAAV